MSSTARLHERPTGWTSASLGALADYINGYPFRPDQWKDHGTPIIRIAQMKDPSTDTDRFPGALTSRYRIDDGDLLFSWSATLMTLIWSRGPAYVNQHIFKVVPRPGVDLGFLHHVLDFSIEDLAARSHGTTMRHITQSDLLPFRVLIPPLPEQQRIAAILDTLDDGIRRTEAAIAKLGLVKQGLLHDLMARGIDESGCLRPPPEDAPHLYGATGLGGLPADWRVSPLSEWLVGTPKNGYSALEVGEWTGTVVLGLGCLTLDGFRPLHLKSIAARDGNVSRALLRDRDLLISRSNTRDLVGLAGVYRDVGIPCVYPDLMMRLTPAATTSPDFLEIVLCSPTARAQLQAMASGTSGSMVKINATIVRDVLIPMPPLGEQQRIVEASEKLSSRARTECRVAQKLQALKHGVLDDLLSGRVRVPVVEEATA